MSLAHPRRARGLLRALASTARVWAALWPRRSPTPPEFSAEAARRRHIALKNHLRYLPGARDLNGGRHG